jgi:hypothetical protein
MSVLEQWEAFGEQLEQAGAGLQCRHEDYRGFGVKAAVTSIEHGFAMQVCIEPPATAALRRVVRTPAWDAAKFATAEAALTALLAYGRAIIDGIAAT